LPWKKEYLGGSASIFISPSKIRKQNNRSQSIGVRDIEGKIYGKL
jgi:hypothetical protein